VAAVSGASAVELQQLRDAAIAAGIATQFSPTEATLGLRELSPAGFSAQESMRLLIPVLDLAAGSLGELSPQQAAGLASQAMKAFGISIDEALISVDRMLQAVNVFALNASELPLALGTASRGAQALHQSLSETLIALGLVKNVIPGVDRALHGLGRSRRIAYRTRYFIAAAVAVAQSDLVLTLPRRPGRHLARQLDLAAYAPPLALPASDVLAPWHARLNDDPLHAWVREAVFDAANAPERALVTSG